MQERLSPVSLSHVTLTNTEKFQIAGTTVHD